MYLPHVLEVVAACRGEPAAALADAITSTARRFFGLPDPFGGVLGHLTQKDLPRPSRRDGRVRAARRAYGRLQ
jgi:hypothetical protein